MEKKGLITVKNKFSKLLCLLAIISVLLSGCSFVDDLVGNLNPDTSDGGTPEGTPSSSVSLDEIPEFDGESPYVIINDNVPFFTDERTDTSYETYSELDKLGRCGVAIANIGTDLMPTEERGSISHVRPTGWHSVQYDVVGGNKYLYNRCHLIGFQLTGENDNRQNLITGTRYMNNEGMLPFENMIADYIKDTGHHVLYRVTPIYDGDDLVARGVLLEAKSVEDDDISVCVYFYNAQPGVTIDYATGESRLSTDPVPDKDKNEGSTEAPATDENEETYVLNTSSKKFHKPTCSYASSMSEENREEYTGLRQDLVDAGYTPCGSCKP